MTRSLEEAILSGKPYDVIAEELGLTHLGVHTFATEMKELPDTPIGFLTKPRTVVELEKKFGPKYQSVLDKEYKGSHIAKVSKDVTTYQLVPTSVKSTEFVTHRPLAEQGGLQRSLFVDLPESCFVDDTYYFLPLYDVHYGHRGHKYDEFLQHIDFIKNTPNVSTFIGGDIMENAMEDGRGMCYDTIKPPDVQVDDLLELLAPISHKILFTLPGNHENRTRKGSGQNINKLIARELKIESFDGSVRFMVSAGAHSWEFMARHGLRCPSTPTGIQRAAMTKVGNPGFIHFNISGHVHCPNIYREPFTIMNSQKKCEEQWICYNIIAGSFMDWLDTYAYRMDYSPALPGNVIMGINLDGSYCANYTSELTGRRL